MPYSLRGNSVVKSDSGEVVKTHPSREKALAHLRALKANVEETLLCECGAPARGLVCQRGHRLELREDWAKWNEDHRYRTKPHYRRTDVEGPGGKGHVINLFPTGVGFNAFHEGTYLSHHPAHDDAVRAVVDHLKGRSSLQEAWSPEARAAALAARRGHSGGGGVAEATKRYEEIERRADKIAYLGTGKEEFPGGISVEGRGYGSGEHAVVTGPDGKQTKVYSGRGGDAGHTVAAMSAASDHPDSPGGATRLSIDPRAAADSYAAYTGLDHKSQIASGFKQAGPVTGSFKARPPQALRLRGQ